MTDRISRSIYFILLTTLFACQPSSESPSTSTGETPSMKAPEAIQAQYYVRYVEDEKELKAEASFIIGAKSKEKKYKTFSSVLLNNNPMRLDQPNAERSFYKLDQKGEAPQRMAFQLISEGGKKEEDIVVIPAFKDFSFGKTISRSNDGLLTWEGSPLGDKESLVLLFTDDNGRTTSTILNGPTSTNEVQISSKKIQAMESGKKRVYIVRKNRFIENKKGLDGAPRDIRALTEYYSKTIEVEVLD